MRKVGDIVSIKPLSWFENKNYDVNKNLYLISGANCCIYGYTPTILTYAGRFIRIEKITEVGEYLGADPLTDEVIKEILIEEILVQ